jgi:hypothetical protein
MFVVFLPQGWRQRVLNPWSGQDEWQLHKIGTADAEIQAMVKLAQNAWGRKGHPGWDVLTSTWEKLLERAAMQVRCPPLCGGDGVQVSGMSVCNKLPFYLRRTMASCLLFCSRAFGGSVAWSFANMVSALLSHLWWLCSRRAVLHAFSPTDFQEWTCSCLSAW